MPGWSVFAAPPKRSGSVEPGRLRSAPPRRVGWGRASAAGFASLRGGMLPALVWVCSPKRVGSHKLPSVSHGGRSRSSFRPAVPAGIAPRGERFALRGIPLGGVGCLAEAWPPGLLCSPAPRRRGAWQCPPRRSVRAEARRCCPTAPVTTKAVPGLHPRLPVDAAAEGRAEALPPPSRVEAREVSPLLSPAASRWMSKRGFLFPATRQGDGCVPGKAGIVPEKMGSRQRTFRRVACR